MDERYRYTKHLPPYSAVHIRKLDPQQHIRYRPGMYFGGIDKKALHNTIDYLLSDALESAYIHDCNEIHITLKPDAVVSIQYNDTVLPQFATSPPKHGKHPIDLVFTNVGHGGVFRKPTHITSGIFGTTIPAVPPVSIFFSATVYKGKKIWKRTYHQGKPHGGLLYYTLNQPQPDGVSITFQPDFSIFEPNDFDYDWIRDRCQTLAYLFPQVTISLTDEREGHEQSEDFHYPNGIRSMVHDRNLDKSERHEILYTKQSIPYPISYRDGTFEIIVEVALQYTDSDAIDLRGYVNSVETKDGGTHIEGFRHALMGYLNGANPNPLSWEQVAQGLTAVINVMHPDPQFESQTSVKLLNPEAFNAVESVMYPLLTGANLRESVAMPRDEI